MLTALRQAVAEDAIRLRGLMSHMVFADQPDNPLHEFRPNASATRSRRPRRGAAVEVVHLANSSATMSRPDPASTWCGPVSPCTV